IDGKNDQRCAREVHANRGVKQTVARSNAEREPAYWAQQKQLVSLAFDQGQGDQKIKQALCADQSVVEVEECPFIVMTDVCKQELDHVWDKALVLGVLNIDKFNEVQLCRLPAPEITDEPPLIHVRDVDSVCSNQQETSNRRHKDERERK